MWELDLSTVKTDSDLLPKGTYNVKVTDVETKKTKAGTGEYLSVTMQVIDGEYKGKKLFHMFNTKNPNAETVEYGIRDLKKMAVASGMSPNDKLSIDAVRAFVCAVTVKIEENETYGDKNKITGFKKPVQVPKGPQGTLNF